MLSKLEFLCLEKREAGVDCLGVVESSPVFPDLLEGCVNSPGWPVRAAGKKEFDTVMPHLGIQLRYGTNPHQPFIAYAPAGSVTGGAPSSGQSAAAQVTTWPTTAARKSAWWSRARRSS